MSFEAHPVVITIALERPVLACPIDDASSHGRPIVSFVLLYRILRVAVTNAVFGQKIIAVGIRRLTAGRGISRIPVEHEMGRLYGTQNLGSFGPRGGIETGIIFQKQDNTLLARFVGGLQQPFIYGSTIWNLILQPPEVEAAHAISAEGFRHCDGALQNFVLLIEGEVCVEIVRRTEF